MNLVTFIIQPLYFSECGGELTLKVFSLRLDIKPYKKLDKRVKNFKD